MKILKSNTLQVFDTDDINFIQSYKGNEPSDISKSLHHNHELTDHDFLSEYFPANHQIFNDFSKSFYWVV
jgi:hypothetical protein